MDTSQCQLCSHHIHQDTFEWILWNSMSPPRQLGELWVLSPLGYNSRGPILAVCCQNWPLCSSAENPDDWPVVNSRMLASLCTSRQGLGVAWWNTGMLNLQTLTWRCFWSLSSSISTGQTATVYLQQTEGDSMRSMFCLTVGKARDQD